MFFKFHSDDFIFQSQDFPRLPATSQQPQPQLVKRILIIVNQTFTRNRRRNVNIRGKGKHGTEPGTEILDISKVQNTIKYTYNKAKSSESFHKTRKCFLIVIGEIYKEIPIRLVAFCIFTALYNQV